MTPPLDPLAAHLMQLLPSDGSSMGNGVLQRMLGHALGRPIGAEVFTAARDTLLSAGAVARGMGRGGSLHLSDGMREVLAAAPTSARPVTVATPTHSRGSTNVVPPSSTAHKNPTHAHR